MEVKNKKVTLGKRIETIIGKNDYYIEKIYTESQIAKRATKLGEKITEDYKDKELIIICVLKGATMFFSELCKNIDNPTTKQEYVKLSYYGNNHTSTNVTLEELYPLNIEGKHVLVVEDIINTGKTLTRLYEYLSELNPKSIRCATLLDKPSRREVEFEADYIGFEISNFFAVGYGLDDGERYRELPYIGEKKKKSFTRTRRPHQHSQEK